MAKKATKFAAKIAKEASRRAGARIKDKVGSYPLPSSTPEVPKKELVGSCACIDVAPVTVRLPAVHERVDFQMLTVFCRQCQTTFYLVERKG